MELYLKTKTGADAFGEYDPATKIMIVRKGSIVSPNVHTGGKFRSANAVLRCRELYCEDGKTKQDVAFKSASTAANFVTGCSSDGLIKWKNSDGVKLRVLLSE